MKNDRLGRPLSDLRISVTDRCNFRCPYCMPSEMFGEAYKFLPRDLILTFEEITRLAGLASRLGARKIRLTGGEPLLREDLPDLISMLKNIEGIEDVAMTTNGMLLGRQAVILAKAGLDRVTISLDSLDDGIFRQMSGRDKDDYGPPKILEGIEAAAAAGLNPVKVNAVVVKGLNEDGIADLAGRFKGTGHILRFIEFMDVGTLNEWQMEKVIPAAEIVKRINARYPIEPIGANYRGEVASRYRYTDGQGEIGVIAAVTKPFCGDCTRARLATDGSLYTCLFGTEGTDLKTPMRAGATDDELLELLGSIWRGREDRYSELRMPRPKTPPGRVEMYRIGG